MGAPGGGPGEYAPPTPGPASGDVRHQTSDIRRRVHTSGTGGRGLLWPPHLITSSRLTPSPAFRLFAWCPTFFPVTRYLPALLALLALSACRIERAPAGRPGGGYAVEPDSVASAEVYAALHGYYATLSSREWRRVADRFLPGATVTDLVSVAGDSAPRPRILGLEEYLVRAGRARWLGFTDEPMHVTIVSYGHLADAWVTYRASTRVRRDSMMTRYGLDAFHLVKTAGRWRIAGLASQDELPGLPIVPGPAPR